MTQSEEIAFLESLMSDELGEFQPAEAACPEPGIFWALTHKDRNDSEMVKELRAHVAGCRSCADLARRLDAFHRETCEEASPVADNGWFRVQPRLSQWMTRYLRSQQEPRSERSWWKLQDLSWGMRFATAGCALALLVAALAWGIYGSNSREHRGPEVAVIPSRNEVQQAPSPNAPGGDAVLMNGRHQVEPDKGIGDAPPSITLSPGDHVRLVVEAVQAQADGSYSLQGQLSPAVSDGVMAYTAEVRAVYSAASTKGLELSVREATMNGKTYRPQDGGHGRRLTASSPPIGIGVPYAGELLEITVLIGKVSLTTEP